MANVTYLLGAGASYNALPVVDELPNAIADVISTLSSIKNGNNRTFNSLYIASNQFDHIINDLNFLRQGCINHLSIDTFCKMLFLTQNREDYLRAKTSMILFFQLYKCFNKSINNKNRPNSQYSVNRQTDLLDKRYDAFLASILVDSYDMFPENIKVLSWNYDNQFERSYHKYIINAKTENTIQSLLNIYRKDEKELKFDNKKFGIYKINGSTEYKAYNDKQEEEYIGHFNTLSEEDAEFKEILHNYKACTSDPDNVKACISFAWDSPESTHRLLENIKIATKDTHHLVIIGYSFPFFNRRIDYEVIRNMKGLRKIYIQDPNAEEIKDRIKAIKTEFQDPQQAALRLISVPNTKQFYLPDELT